MDKSITAPSRVSTAEFTDGRTKIGLSPLNKPDNKVKLPQLFADIYMDSIER
jgi:hypothetical protein